MVMLMQSGVGIVLDTAELASDVSIFALFGQADIVIKVVMILLALASLISWTLIFEKLFIIGRQYSRVKKFEHVFWSGQAIDKLYEDVKDRNDCYLEMVFIAGIREYKDDINKGNLSEDIIVESVSNAMRVESSRLIEKCEKNIDFLATIGSTAPFIGLFGTVLGILNSFQSIALTKNTTLSVVAPGIAEALLATAMGLVVAIPAVFFYNRLSTKINSLAVRIENFSSELLMLLVKDIK